MYETESITYSGVFPGVSPTSTTALICSTNTHIPYLPFHVVNKSVHMLMFADQYLYVGYNK